VGKMVVGFVVGIVVGGLAAVAFMQMRVMQGQCPFLNMDCRVSIGGGVNPDPATFSNSPNPVFNQGTNRSGNQGGNSVLGGVSPPGGPGGTNAPIVTPNQSPVVTGDGVGGGSGNSTQGPFTLSPAEAARKALETQRGSEFTLTPDEAVRKALEK
jgi:hypothetical protein